MRQHDGVGDPNWTDVVAAISGILTPALVAVFGVIIARRQSRSQLLQQARFDYYELLAPDLNRLMCYMTFIGTWRDDSPEEIVALKRRLDSSFHVGAPLFSKEVTSAYRNLMDLTFSTFGNWGQDAVIRSGAYRRRKAWRRADLPWDPQWQSMFKLRESETISADALTAYRRAYDGLLKCLVVDLSITRARKQYTTPDVSYNASAPRHEDITGAPKA